MLQENSTKNTIYSRFKARVETMPDALAIVEDVRSVTFGQLDALVNSILARFVNKGYMAIGICMSHGINQIAAMLAVLKSGAAYIPAEPSLPVARRDYMMNMAGVELVITDDFCRDPHAVKDFPDQSTQSGVAYVLFTSGTSGKPKGVVVENHSVVNYARAFGREMEVGPGDVMLQYSICSFDIFVEEVFASLLNGVALAIPSKEIHDGSLDNLMAFCRRRGVTIIDGFPYLVADINHQSELLPSSVRLIISGGDVVRANYISHLRDRGIKIYNTYGPSETTVCSNYYRIDNAEPLADGTFPIGHAVDGVQVAILDPDLNPVPDGETGEICITGEGVARGYLGNPPEQKNFVTLPDERKMFRSGDMGYRLPDGNLVFLHRRDEQVMILGRRVEPEEVENVLNQYPGIDRGAVRALKDEAGLHFLVAYLEKNDYFSLADFKHFLAERLVDFMVPEFFVAMKSIPLNQHGKVDTRALPKILKDKTY
ncbi:MAG: amino acid adenylation domain-containing protein [Muribaculaceae bacterium]|nr:amino acid adenylation domain-containing protein [Muribaculaceae bacterium]